MAFEATARHLPAAPWLQEWQAGLNRAAAHPDTGAFCTWGAAFELLAELEHGPDLAPAIDAPAWMRYWRQTLDRERDRPRAEALRRKLHAFYAAWRTAEGEYAAGRRVAPTFALLDLDQPTPLRAHRPRLDPLQRAAQRHRYKGALADNLEAFAREHLVVDPRNRTWRPRWIDHRWDCTLGRCHGCARIPLPPPPPWRIGARKRAGRRLRRDYLTVPEWLIDRAAAARGCQDVVALQDARCSGIVVVPQSCHVRAEPDCESARQARVLERYRAAVEALDPDRARFVTLTIRNVPRGELAAGIAALQHNVDKLKNRAIWRGGRCRDRARCRQPWDSAKRGWKLPHDPVTASMTTTEVTYNRPARSWHPHAHLLIESDWIDQGELSESWDQITAGSPIVWISSVKRHAAEHWAGDVTGALRELLKYAAKPHPAFLDQKDPAVVAELLVALRGRHLTSTSGKLYGLELDQPDEPRDLVLVWPDEGAERPYHAPRLCPHHDGEAEWRVLRGRHRRRDARSVPDRSRPGRSILSMEAGAMLAAETRMEPTDAPTPIA